MILTVTTQYFVGFSLAPAPSCGRMCEPGRPDIAASRALYFSELSGVSPEDNSVGRVKRPSYVGISNSLNGYTPYAPYRTSNDPARKISPPLHLPNQAPLSLDSVSLVLREEGDPRFHQESYLRSLNEFDETMRDLNMGRPENGDMTDNGSCIMRNEEDFYPRSHMKQVIGNGESKTVTTITQFHSSAAAKHQNLVSKQIERLYGADPLAQVRLTSPEPPGCEPASNGETPVTEPQRKHSGGFFSKRFGITKMKDHSTLKSSPETPKEYKPLKVPAVFKLLRPEFREQLKQSSCKVSMPEEGGKERIIPIHMDSSPRSSKESTPRTTTTTPRSTTTPATPATAERVIPITRLSNGSAPPALNGHSNGHTNGSTNGTVNGLSSTPLSSTNGVNGGIRRPVPTVIGFRNNNLNNNSSSSTANEKGVEKEVGKPLVIRKLSPLSPKHIGVGSSKPAPAPKPEHLMSPPLSPTPSDEARSPILSSRSSPQPSSSPAPPQDSSSVTPKAAPTTATATTTATAAATTTATAPATTTPVASQSSSSAPPTQALEKLQLKEEVPDATPEEMEEVSEKDMEEDHGYRYNEEEQQEQYPEYYQCGLREREFLCPILEEDNESTASGSILNLQTNQGPYSPDDPLLLTEQGEVQDGYYFIKVLENEIFKFEEQICDFEEELSMRPDIPEEGREFILLTVGMAKLLMGQKMQQFRGLCDKNNNVGKEEDPFVPTSQDLAGFWDMVHIQVDQVHGKFAELQKLRSQGWKIKKPEPIKKAAGKKGSNKTVNKPIKPKEKSEAAKARDEARKKMMEMKKKAMKEKQAQADSDLVILM